MMRSRSAARCCSSSAYFLLLMVGGRLEAAQIFLQFSQTIGEHGLPLRQAAAQRAIAQARPCAKEQREAGQQGDALLPEGQHQEAGGENDGQGEKNSMS
jgi:hypothetical protein